MIYQVTGTITPYVITNLCVSRVVMNIDPFIPLTPILLICCHFQHSDVPVVKSTHRALRCAQKHAPVVTKRARQDVIPARKAVCAHLDSNSMIGSVFLPVSAAARIKAIITRYVLFQA